MAQDKDVQDPDVTALIEQFRESQDQTQEARGRAERDRDYYDGHQLTEEEEATLEKRGQPVVISNRIKPKIDALIGFEKRQRTDPKAYPRTPKHDTDAEAATDALRFVCESNSFDKIRSDVSENLFIEGAGAVTVGMVARPNGDMDVQLNHVPWDRFYYDPHSRRRDFSDAGYLGVVVWMDEADALTDYKGKDDIIAGCYLDSDDDGDSSSDRPKIVWSSRQRKRIRVLQHRWKKGGVWMTATICRGGFLREAQESPFKDEWGTPECDLIAVSAYVDRKNNRYGVVRQHISPQDEINKRRSKLLHRLSVDRVVADEGAVENVAHAKRELAKPDGFVQVRPNARFEIADKDSATVGEMQLLQEAKAEIDASGVNPSLEGDQAAPSGRAQEIQQTSALSEMAVVFDALKDWSWRVYRASWNRVRQYWTDEKWVRVTDDESNVRFVGLNHPVTVQEEVENLQKAGQQIPQELQQLMQMNPQAVLRIDGPVADMDVDILVEDGPDSVTLQSEQYQALVELKKADPTAISTKAIIQASSLRNKDSLLEELEKGGIPPQVQQQIQELQQSLQQAQQELQQTQQEAQASQADTQIKGVELQIKQQELAIKQQELQIDKFRAETERITALNPPQPEARPERAFS